MPRVYADTSALFAFFHPRDAFALPVTVAAQKESPDFVYWSFLKFELRHNLRQANTDADGRTAWNALRATERTKARFQWADLKLDRILESAESLSELHALDTLAGASDFLHVAAAQKIKATTGLDEFWTCDQAQAATARKVGLKTKVFPQAD